MTREFKYVSNSFNRVGKRSSGGEGDGSHKVKKGKGSQADGETTVKKGKGSQADGKTTSKKGKGSQADGKTTSKKGKGKGKEGFNGEKGCSGGSGFFSNLIIFKLFGIILWTILGLIFLMPVVMPLVCAFMSSFGIASALSFDSLKFINLNMCSVKQYSFVIKLLVVVILIHQILNRYSYGDARGKFITMSVYLFILIVYIIVETFKKTTDTYFDDLKCKT